MLDEEKKNSLKAIYGELRGLYASVEDKTKGNGFTRVESYWKDVNNIVEEIESLTGGSYRRFVINPNTDMSNDNYIHFDTYRTKVAGLIGRLRAEYFPDSPDPFSGSPSTSTVITQQVSQDITISMRQIQEKVEEKLQDPNLAEGEKSFLDELKKTLNSVTDSTELLNKVINLATRFGLSLESLSKIFG